MLSHETAIILLLPCVLYLSFKLYSHATLWEEEVQSNSGADDHESSSLQFQPACALVLVIILVLIIVCVRYLISSVDGLVATSHITVNFTGLVLLPVNTNLPNYIKTYAVAYEAVWISQSF